MIDCVLCVERQPYPDSRIVGYAVQGPRIFGQSTRGTFPTVGEEYGNIEDCYVAVESRDTLERRDIRLWRCTMWVIGSSFFSLEGVVSRASPGGGPGAQSPERKRASIPVPGGWRRKGTILEKQESLLSDGRRLVWDYPGPNGPFLRLEPPSEKFLYRYALANLERLKL